MATTTTTGRKLIAPLSGPTLLFPNERSLYDAEPKRNKGANVHRPRALCYGQDGLIHIEYTAELVAVHGYGADDREHQHELLGEILSADGKHLAGVVDQRRRVSELLAEANGDMPTLRGLVSGWSALARTYESEPVFIAAARERCCPQHDYGFNWREGGYGHRLGYIPDSNEVFAVVRDGTPAGGRVELLARVADKDELDRLLKPLWRLHGTRNSLARVRGALATVRHSDGTRRRPSVLAS